MMSDAEGCIAVGRRRGQSGYFPDDWRPGLLLFRVFDLPLSQGGPDHLAHAIVFVLVTASSKLGIDHARKRRQPAIAANRPLRVVVKDLQGDLAGEVFDICCTGLMARLP